MDKLYLIKSAIVGFAVGDALGVPVEFSSREKMDEFPVDSMRGFGTYLYPAETGHLCELCRWCYICFSQVKGICRLSEKSTILKNAPALPTPTAVR